jgi:FtsZ-binding cell division protein ZapB
VETSVLTVLRSNLSKMIGNQALRDYLQIGIRSYLGGDVAKLNLQPPAQSDVMNLLQLTVGATMNLNGRVDDQQQKQKNLREAVKRAITRIDTMDHDTTDVRDRLSGMLGRLDDVEHDVSMTKVKLESHIEVSDQRHDLSEHRHTLAEVRYVVNKDKIAKVVSMLASSDERHDQSDERHDVSEHRHEVTDARFFDVMQHVADLQERVSGLEAHVRELEAGASASKARADEHEDDLDYVLPLVKRYDLAWQKADIAMEGRLMDLD